MPPPWKSVSTNASNPIEAEAIARVRLVRRTLVRILFALF